MEVILSQEQQLLIIPQTSWRRVFGTVDVSTVGDYTLTYTFTDVSGNVGSGTRLVEVRPAGTTETGTSTYSTGTGTSTSSATSTGSST